MQTEQQIFQLNLINQSLAAVYNCIYTGRPNEAINMLEVVQRIEPENPLVPDFFRLIAAKSGLCDQPELAEKFGKEWGGENLDGCTIEVFCDQGMGDTINMLRYLYLLKTRWNCHIVLNCYAYFEQFERLFKDIDYIDEFVKFHKTCDYFTNVFSLPTILSGIELPIYYPAHFALVMQKGVPPQPMLPAYPTFSSADALNNLPEKPRVGVAWKSNPDNQLSLIKSIQLDVVENLKSPMYDLWSLHPDECPSFMNKIQLKDLYDTAAVISCLDYVISVDTVVLHLAGAMQTPTFGLIPDGCDPRWGTEGDATVWYPSVKLIRQNGDWLNAVIRAKESIESLINIV
jgi:hypothetical protein